MNYASNKIYTTTLQITPQIAIDMLQYNKANRRLSPKTVDFYAQMMTDGKWALTNQGIGFYENGTLADGQHRLYAIVKSGKPVTMNVTYGIKSDTVYAIDTLRARTTYDALSIMGDTISKSIIGAIRAAADINGKMPAYDVRNFYESHKDWCDIVKKIFSNSIVGVSNRSVGGAIFTLLNANEPHDTVERFCEAVTSDCTIDSSNGAKTVCRYAIRLRTTKNGTGYSDVRKLLCTTQRIYQAFKKDELLTKIIITDQPRYPFISIK